MRRRLLNLLTALSLTFLLTAAALFWRDRITREATARDLLSRIEMNRRQLHDAKRREPEVYALREWDDEATRRADRAFAEVLERTNEQFRLELMLLPTASPSPTYETLVYAAGMLFLMMAVCSAGFYLWEADRRRERERARLCGGCGRELAGEAGGACPACGAIQAVREEPASPSGGRWGENSPADQSRMVPWMLTTYAMSTITTFSILFVTSLGRPWRLVLFGLWLAQTAVLAWRLHWIRVNNVPPGNCRHCGYSLVGNVTGVCPECGTAKV